VSKQQRARLKTQDWRVDLETLNTSVPRSTKEGQTIAGVSLLLRYANLVKLPHTVFALPFALLGVVYGSWHASVTWDRLLLVIVAFTAARFAAMAFNRIVDRKMDSLNPRTRRREITSHRLCEQYRLATQETGEDVFVDVRRKRC